MLSVTPNWIVTFSFFDEEEKPFDRYLTVYASSLQEASQLALRISSIDGHSTSHAYKINVYKEPLIKHSSNLISADKKPNLTVIPSDQDD